MGGNRFNFCLIKKCLEKIKFRFLFNKKMFGKSFGFCLKKFRFLFNKKMFGEK